MQADATLDAAAEALATSPRTWAPVVEDGRVVGILALRELVAGYRGALAASLRRLERTGRTTLVEAPVAPTSPLAGRTVAEAAWPPGTVVLSVQRARELLLADGSTTLAAGDLVTALVHPSAAEGVRAVLAGGATPERETEPPGPELV